MFESNKDKNGFGDPEQARNKAKNIEVCFFMAGLQQNTQGLTRLSFFFCTMSKTSSALTAWPKLGSTPSSC
jgi:hypothetical protein